MISNDDVDDFLMLFRGKRNTYVKNRLPQEKPVEGQKQKTDITNCTGKIDNSLMRNHLEGKFGVGICPVNTEGKCYFGVLDIDYYKPKIKRVLHFIREYQLPLLPFRSKSGGLHVYLMLAKPISAKTMRDLLGKISYSFSLEEIYGNGKVEIFPKQERTTEEGFGSSITLPYFNAANNKQYTYLMDLEGNEIPFNEALSYIRKHFTNTDEVKEALSKLPYNDAPPCIQRLLISGEVGSEDSGRNNFLFSLALYASKKYGDNFESFIKEINSSFEAPLSEEDLDNITKSIKEHEYSYKCKDIPCSGYCNKNECRKREFGLGRDKGHFADIDYGPLLRYKAAEPYYVWKLKRKDQEEYKEIIFKDEGAILDQKNFAKLCVRNLNFAPRQVAQNDWFMTINKVLSSIQDIEVKQERDTSGLASIRNSLIKFLANKQSRRDIPVLIRSGLCYRQSTMGDDGKEVNKYYFTHEGFEDYLRNHKISFELNMLGENLREFGAKPDILHYTNMTGEPKQIMCWSMAETEDIVSTYEGYKEIEASDKAMAGLKSVSEASNIEETEIKSEEEKLYSEEDVKNASDLF